MTEETQTDYEADQFTQTEAKDFKQYYAHAVNGILSSVPFGVTVDPSALAVIARNVATAMVQAQREVLPEELHESEKSNFPSSEITKEELEHMVDALVKHDRNAAVEVLTSFGVASIARLDKAQYRAAYLSLYARLPTTTV